MTAKGTLIAMAWLAREPFKPVWTSDLTHYINDGCGGMVMDPEESLYPSEIRKLCYRLKEAGYVKDVSWGRFFLTGHGWETALALTGGKGLL